MDIISQRLTQINGNGQRQRDVHRAPHPNAELFLPLGFDRLEVCETPEGIPMVSHTHPLFPAVSSVSAVFAKVILLASCAQIAAALSAHPRLARFYRPAQHKTRIAKKKDEPKTFSVRFKRENNRFEK